MQRAALEIVFALVVVEDEVVAAAAWLSSSWALVPLIRSKRKTPLAIFPGYVLSQ